jgi:hypothetical protein
MINENLPYWFPFPPALAGGMFESEIVWGFSQKVEF